MAQDAAKTATATNKDKAVRKVTNIEKDHTELKRKCENARKALAQIKGTVAAAMLSTTASCRMMVVRCIPPKPTGPLQRARAASLLGSRNLGLGEGAAPVLPRLGRASKSALPSGI